MGIVLSLKKSLTLVAAGAISMINELYVYLASNNNRGDLRKIYHYSRFSKCPVKIVV